MRRVAASLLIVLALILAACGGAPSSETAGGGAGQSQPTESGNGQQEQPAQQEQAADAKGIAEALKAKGLPIGKIESFTAETDPNERLGRPGQYISKANFVDKRIKEPIEGHVDVDNGGAVEVFANKDDAVRWYDYNSEIAKSGLFTYYVYLEGNVVLRLSGKLTPEQAKEYEEAFKEVVK